jgi:aryl-alcohol dehydrogenase-like predicted oxidoreductase
MALAFVNTRPFVLSNIIGATSMEQLKMNLDSLDVVLEKEVLKGIAAIQQALPNPSP